MTSGRSIASALLEDRDLFGQETKSDEPRGPTVTLIEMSMTFEVVPSTDLETRDKQDDYVDLFERALRRERIYYTDFGQGQNGIVITLSGVLEDIDDMQKTLTEIVTQVDQEFSKLP